MKNKIVTLEGVRGIACLLVFTSHCYELLSYNRCWQTYASDFGRLGVLIFFSLSGYLTMLNNWNAPVCYPKVSDGLNNVVRKLKKIYPLYLFSLAEIFILTFHSFVIPEWEDNPVKLILLIFLHLFLVQAYIPKIGVCYAFNGPAWFLSACLLLWLLTPYLIWAIKRIKKVANKAIWILLLGLLVYEIVIYNLHLSEQRWFIYVNPGVNLLIYVLGMLSSAPSEILKRRKIDLSLIYSILLVVLFMVKNIVPVDFRIIMWIPVVVVWIPSIATRESRVNKLLTNKILLFIGKISMEMFLVHYGICTIFNNYIEKTWYSYPLCLTTSCFMAYLLYRIRKGGSFLHNYIKV